MLRHRLTPRTDWQRKVEEIGLTYHSHETGPYWDESVAYELSLKQITALYAAGNAVNKLCLQAARAII